MGTAQDQLDLLGGDVEALDRLEDAVRRHLGFATSLTSVGQVYPRSLDYEVVTALAQSAAGPASLATTLRLMAGLDLATEGFVAGQVGSSAMPHKMNARSCERIVGLKRILEGHVTMVGAVAGDQWNEGDVSCSVVRRVALPDAFYADRRRPPDDAARPGRVRRVPPGGGRRARSLPALPVDHRDARGPRPPRPRPGGGPRAAQGPRGGGGLGGPRARAPRPRVSSTAWRPTSAFRWTGRTSTP